MMMPSKVKYRKQQRGRMRGKANRGGTLAFGDMDHEPVVRLSEALDIRSGWRQPHAHD